MADEMEKIAARLRLRRLQLEKSLQDISDKAGITKSTLQRYEKESIKNLPLNKLKDLADALQTTPEWIMGWDTTPSTDHSQWVPVLGRVAAGIPLDMIEDVLDYEEIPDHMGECFALRIQGDSMSPDIPNGSTVIVRKQDDVESGEIAIVAVNGEDATCKKVIKHELGITLASLNPSFEPMVFGNHDIEEMPIRILGRVMEVRRRF